VVDDDIIEMIEVAPGEFVSLQECLERHEAAHEAARREFNVATDVAMNEVLRKWVSTGKSRILKEFCRANGIPFVEIKMPEE
jgi:hypothetical protein